MSSNIYRFSLIGETLGSTLDELSDNYGVNTDICDRIKEKFDEIANKNICKDISAREREKYALAPAHIIGTEVEFKFHDGKIIRSVETITEGRIHQK